MTRFRQALLDELLTRVADPADQPAPASRGILRRRPRLLLATGGGLAVLAAAATLVLTKAPTTPAYTLTANKDGTVTVTFNHIADPDGVNQALREAGVRAAVFLPEPAASCPVPDRGTPAMPTAGIAQAFSLNTALVWDTEDRVDVARLRPDQIPAGTMLVLIPRSHGPRGEAGFYLYSSLYREPGPKCVADDVWSGPISPAPAGPVASASAAGDSTGIPDSPGPGGSPR